MTHIFLSYRREDSSIATGHMYDRLADFFGRSAIFKDVDNIPLGVNFADHVAGVIDKCAVQLVVIGPRWLAVTDAQGQPRLNDPKDFVRLEIEAAMRRGIPIIPLMVDGASVPPADRLPSTLRELPLQNGAVIRGTDFDRDVGRVAVRLAQWVKPLPGVFFQPRRSLVVAGLLFGLWLALLDIPVAGIGAFWAGSLTNNGSAGNLAGALLLLVFCLSPGLIMCWRAGRSAARGTGSAGIGAAAGLIAGVLGSVVGGALFGGLLGTPAVSRVATGSVTEVEGGIFLGVILWVLGALVVGPAFGALGGLLGRRTFQQSVRPLTRPQ